MTARAHTVLLVEDERDLREITREVIEDTGRPVAEAANGKEAQEYLRAATPPCLILLDLMMPVMNGWDFLAWLAAQPEPLASVPVVIVSAASLDRLTSTLQTAQTAGLIQKPYNHEDLLRALNRFC